MGLPLLSFCGFVLGCIFFYTFFFCKSVFRHPLEFVGKNSTFSGIVAWLSVIAFLIPFSHNLVWVLSYMSSLFLFSFFYFFKIFPFEFWNFPCSDTVNTCWPMEQIKWGDASADFWIMLTMFFSIQLYSALAFYLFFILPVISFFSLMFHSIKNKNSSVEEFFEGNKSAFKSIFYFLIGLDDFGRLMWIIVLSLPLLHLILISFAFAPSIQLIFYAIITGLSLLTSLLLLGTPTLTATLEKLPTHPVKFCYYRSICLVSSGVVFVSCLAGVLFSFIWFTFYPESDRFLLITTERFDGDTDSLFLIFGFLNFLICGSVVVAFFFFIKSIFHAILKTIQNYRQFEAQFLEERKEIPEYA
ncbi:hypothetical protein GEMRC1_006018 [Eukaryota sp. GEM-RC1]